MAPPVETLSEPIGNAGTQTFDEHDPTTCVRYLAVRWDRNVVAGIKWTYFNGVTKSFGNFDDAGKTLSSYDFVPHEYLSTMRLHDSGFGYRSVRQIIFATLNPVSTPPTPNTFSSGPDGFDNEVSPDAYGRYICGFKGGVNPDNFMQWVAVYFTKSFPADYAPGDGALSALAKFK